MIRDLYVSGTLLLLIVCIVCFADNTLNALCRLCADVSACAHWLVCARACTHKIYKVFFFQIYFPSKQKDLIEPTFENNARFKTPLSNH